MRGNTAPQQKRFDDAILLYDEGLKIVPGEIMLLANKSIAFRLRGADVFNSSLKISDKDLKASGIDKAKTDFNNAVINSGQALLNLRQSIPMELLDWISPQDIKLIVFSNHAENLRLLATYVDKSRSEEAYTAISEYVDVEPDREKRKKVLLGGCKMLLESGNGAKALDEYRIILKEDPEELEAILGVGLALSQSGDKETFEEAKFYLQRFVEKAPDDHPMKADIKQTLTYMN